MIPEEDVSKQKEQPTVEPIVSQPVREQDKIHLILCYLGVLSLVPLLTVKDSAYVQWHAKQGVTLVAAMVLLLFTTRGIPVLGPVIGCSLVVAWVVCSVMGISRALSGERWRIPLVADIAEKF